MFVCRATSNLADSVGLAGTKVRGPCPLCLEADGAVGDTPQPVLARDPGVTLQFPPAIQPQHGSTAAPARPGLCLECPSHPSSANHAISLNPSTFYSDGGYILRDTNPSINRHQLHFMWSIIRRLLTELCHTERESHGGFPHHHEFLCQNKARTASVTPSQTANTHTHTPA